MANKTVAAVVKLIDEFSNPSKEVNTAAKNMEKRISEVGDKFKAVGDVFDSVGSALTKTITAPIIAAGTASLKFASDSQDAFQSFAAATGTATEDMGKYKDMINNVYKDNFGESINDVAEAMATVNQNMSYLDDSALQRCTEYAYTLSDTFGVDVAESTRTADTLIKNYGVSAREAFNLMTQGMQSGLNFSDELFDSIDEYSVQFQKLGLDAEDMFSIFANGAQNGAFNLDKIGDAVKEFSIRAIDGSDTTAEGFKALGMDADAMAQKFAAGGDGAKEAFNQVIQGLASMEDPVAQSAAGVNLFGTMWEDLGPKVVTSLSTANSSIDMTKESMEELVNTKYDTLSGALGGLWRTIQVDVLQPIGTQLIPYVTKGIDIVNKLTDAWNKLSPATQKSIVKFAGIASAAGPVLMGFGKISTGIGALTGDTGLLTKGIMKLTGSQTGFGALTKMFKPLTAVMKSPITMFKTLATTIRHPITSIKSLGTVLTKPVSLFKSLGSVIAHPTQLLKMFGTVIKSPIKSVGMLGTKFVSFTNAVGPVPVALGVIAALAVLIYKNWDKIGPVVKKIADRFVEFWETVQPKLQPLIDKFKEIADFLVGAFNVAFEAAGGYLTSFFESGAELIDNFLGMLEGIIDFLSGVFTGNWEQAWEGLKKIVSNAFSGLATLVKAPINAVIGLVNKAIGAINNISVDLPSIVGGGHIGFNIPTIPTLASGTDNWKGGIAQISERGGEIVDLPSGSRVYPHDESVQKAREEGKKTINITLAKLADQIVVREDADIDRLAEAFAKKLGQTMVNMA